MCNMSAVLYLAMNLIRTYASLTPYVVYMAKITLFMTHYGNICPELKSTVVVPCYMYIQPPNPRGNVTP